MNAAPRVMKHPPYQACQLCVLQQGRCELGPFVPSCVVADVRKSVQAREQRDACGQLAVVQGQAAQLGEAGQASVKASWRVQRFSVVEHFRKIQRGELGKGRQLQRMERRRQGLREGRGSCIACGPQQALPCKRR